MEIQTGALVIVLAYMVGMMIIGYVVGKINIKGSADYLVAGRRMGLFMVAFSLSANNIGGGSTTGLAQKAFGAWGISAIWYVLAASLAMIPLAYFAPKIRKTMAVTIPEVVGRRFGKLSSNFTAVLSVLSLFCLTSSQIGASGAVINALIPTIPLNVCLLLAGFVTIFYTTFGGMIADQVSDLIQFGIILVGLAIATPIVLKHAGGWAAISAALPGEKLNMTQIGWASIIGYFFNYFCTFLCGPEMVSRFETCKDEKTAVRASFLCAILMAAMAVFPTLLGLAAFALKDQLPGLAENGSNAMMIVTGTYAPGIVTGLISAAIICATMSSADSNLLCMSTMIINDIYPGFGGKKKLDKFYPRSFNMGVRRDRYMELGGFSKMRFGEDIDFSIRIFKAGLRCRLFPEAWVWHKRRTDLKKFFKQVHNSGIARINLSKRHPGTLKLVHTLPAIFTAGCALLIVLAVIAAICGCPHWWVMLLPFALFAIIICADATRAERSFGVGVRAVAASFIQLWGYGSGFWRAWWRRCVLGKGEFDAFRNNFYK